MQEGSLDEKVERFLDKMKSRWRDFNVPEEDGKILYETIVKKRYREGLGNRDLDRPFGDMDRVGSKQNGES